ncbi:MAG: nucleoside hydrolase [Spirochaetales bacterium]|nr:nucleoside hydrolase [Spirochaetales bacterium]
MKKIILDCDPGHDDMMAIMLAASNPEIDLLGVTTVAGNQTGAKTFENARKILTLIGKKDLATGKEIPLARGADVPLFKPLTVAPQIHGSSGLDGAELPAPDVDALEIDAVDFIIKTLNESNEKITLVPTGPLTNIAMAFLKAPAIKNKVKEIVLMGGAVYDSNITPAAEFNIYVDPEAAKIVFDSGLPVTMIGLDVTNKSLMTFPVIEDMIGWNGPASKIVGPLMKFFAQANKDNFGIDGAPVHDALAVARVIDPSVVECEFLNVDIETASELTRGQTLADLYKVTGKEPNVDVALKVNVDRFLELLLGAIRTLDEKLK